MWTVEYNYPMIKVDWLAAGAGVLLLSTSIGLVNGQICCVAKDLQIPPANRKQVPAALAKKNQ
jgi:hypothetical protein